MATALAWYETQIAESPLFRKAFLDLVARLSAADMSGATAEPHGPGGVVRHQAHFVAVGKSGGVAQVLVAMLASVGIQARFLHPTEAFHGDFGTVCPGDTVICISNNGRSSELLQVLPRLKERRCMLFAITGRAASPVGQACDHVLPLPAVEESCPLNQAPITSTVTTLALGQLLVAATMESRQFDLEKYARNHPGGAIGKRIFVRVDDLMAKGPHLPAVGESAGFKECVSAMTRFALGALLVVREGLLVGLVSEKDLRTAMETHGPDVFTRRASDFMNSEPVVIPSGALAVDALKVMENRPRPLSVLPVVDEGKKALGLLRLHDLVAEGISLG